jgi:hypothetical protein
MRAEKLPTPVKTVNEYVRQQLLTQLLQHECFQAQCFQQAQQQIAEHLHHQSELR